MSPKGRNKPRRNYRKEYDNYHSSEKQKQNRAGRNKARTVAKKAGKKIKGKDVAHKNGNPRDNKKSNLVVQTASRNRSFPRTRTAGKKSASA